MRAAGRGVSRNTRPCNRLRRQLGQLLRPPTSSADCRVHRCNVCSESNADSRLRHTWDNGGPSASVRTCYAGGFSWRAGFSYKVFGGSGPEAGQPEPSDSRQILGPKEKSPSRIPPGRAGGNRRWGLGRELAEVESVPRPSSLWCRCGLAVARMSPSEGNWLDLGP